MNRTCSLPIVSLLVLELALIVRSESAYGFAYTLDELRCRETVAASTGKLATTCASVLAACHRKRSAGQLVATTDCNSIAAVDTGKIDAATQSLFARVAAACTGVDPAGVAYFQCPAPCSATVPVIDAFDDVAACLDCLARTVTEDMTEASQGAPSPPLYARARTCHAAVGKRQSKHFKTFLRERYACQKAAEDAGADDLSVCANADPRGRIELSRTLGVQSVIDGCTGADLGVVDSCETANTQALAACVLDDAERQGQVVFEASYELGTGVTTTTTTTTTSTTTTLAPQDPQCPESGEPEREPLAAPTPIVSLGAATPGYPVARPSATSTPVGRASPMIRTSMER